MNETKSEPIDGLNTSGLVTAGFVAAVGTFVVIIGLQAVYLRYSQQQESKNRERAVIGSESILAEQHSKLNRYGWLDRENDVVAIPIDRAIEITANKYSQEQTKKKKESDAE